MKAFFVIFFVALTLANAAKVDRLIAYQFNYTNSDSFVTETQINTFFGINFPTGNCGGDISAEGVTFTHGCYIYADEDDLVPTADFVKDYKVLDLLRGTEASDVTGVKRMFLFNVNYTSSVSPFSEAITFLEKMEGLVNSVSGIKDIICGSNRQRLADFQFGCHILFESASHLSSFKRHSSYTTLMSVYSKLIADSRIVDFAGHNSNSPVKMFYLIDFSSSHTAAEQVSALSTFKTRVSASNALSEAICDFELHNTIPNYQAGCIFQFNSVADSTNFLASSAFSNGQNFIATYGTSFFVDYNYTPIVHDVYPSTSVEAFFLLDLKSTLTPSVRDIAFDVVNDLIPQDAVVDASCGVDISGKGLDSKSEVTFDGACHVVFSSLTKMISFTSTTKWFQTKKSLEGIADVVLFADIESNDGTNDNLDASVADPDVAEDEDSRRDFEDRFWPAFGCIMGFLFVLYVGVKIAGSYGKKQ